LAKTPGVDADPPQILHGIAEMGELPVQHRADAVGADDEVAVAEIAVHQRHLLRRTGIAVTQPAQRQFEYRTRPAKAAVFPLEIGNLPGRRHLAKLWPFRCRYSMNAG